MKKILVLFLSLFVMLSTFAKPIKVACVGNSITFGYLVENREKNAYPYQLQTMLGSEYEVGNFGLSGATLLN
ncbi:MAG: sialate O-acetylesterase, partial [Proteiniphilum sp.]|nr:sialate O-acetylesterase [Proteiniphilum sp.]